MGGEFHGVDGQLDIHVAFDLTAAFAVSVFLGRFGDHGEAVIVQPVDQRADRRVIVVFQQRGVVERPQHLAAAHEFVAQQFVINVKAQRLGRGVEVRPIDKKSQSLVFVKHKKSFRYARQPRN